MPTPPGDLTTLIFDARMQCCQRQQLHGLKAPEGAPRGNRHECWIFLTCAFVWSGVTAAQVLETTLAEVFTDKGDTFIRAGSKQGISVGMSVDIVGPRVDGGSDESKLGSCVVMQVWDGMARVSLDASARVASSPKFARFARIEAVQGPIATPDAPSPSTPVDRTTRAEALEGAAHLAHLEHVATWFTVVIRNDGETAWTDCLLTLNDGRRYSGLHLGPGQSETVSLFHFEPRHDQMPAFVDVRCAQGSSRFTITR